MCVAYNLTSQEVYTRYILQRVATLVAIVLVERTSNADSVVRAERSVQKSQYHHQSRQDHD